MGPVNADDIKTAFTNLKTVLAERNIKLYTVRDLLKADL
jgi:hypothetical protein